ncbi:MAG: hypothetical protein KAG92_03305, partial [Deltaproteobacteria bacterium]|nr:hypothetical protein [Deltaproteobacteria bacterium]
ITAGQKIILTWASAAELALAAWVDSVDSDDSVDSVDDAADRGDNGNDVNVYTPTLGMDHSNHGSK